jgi:asparagine synthase (glutamine-hydrolysing)
VRVILTGETADELFGGYGRMRLLRYPRLVSTLGRTLKPFRTRLRVGSRWHRIASASIADQADWIAASYADGDIRRFSPQPLAEWAPYRAQVAAQAVAEHSEPVRQALAYERLTHLPAIVATGDRMTMAAGIETRLPFTDPKLLDFAALARTRDLFQGPHGKQPIRDIAAGKIPAAVLNRRKRGWTSPFVHYTRTVPALARWLAQVPDHEIVARSVFGREWARRTVDDFIAGEDRRARDAWMVGRMVLWHQVCVEGNRRPISEGK